MRIGCCQPCCWCRFENMFRCRAMALFRCFGHLRPFREFPLLVRLWSYASVRIYTTAFRFFVLYSERIRQMEVLSALLGLFGIDVIVVPLVRIALLVRRQIKYAARSETELAGSRQANLLISTLVLLFRAIALFIYNFCFHLLCHKKAKIIFIVLCFVTIKSLVQNDLYLCCRTGYSMLVLWLILPPWQYHKVNQRIFNATLQVWNLCFAWVSSCVVKPIVDGLAAIYEFVKFLVLFKWLFPLINKLYVTFVRPVTNFISRTAEIFIYFTLGGWIPPLCSYIGGKLSQSWQACKRRCYCTWQAFVYVVTFKWVRPVALFILAWTRYIFLGIFLVDLCRKIWIYCCRLVFYIKYRFIYPAMHNMHLAVSYSQRWISKKVRWYMRVAIVYIRQLGLILFYGTLLLWFSIVKYIIKFIIAPVARQGYKLSSRLVNEVSLLCGPPYRQVMATLHELNNELANEDEEELSEYLPTEEMVDDSFKTEERKVRVDDSELLQLPNINDVDSSSDSNESEEFLPAEPIDDVASSSSSTDKELENASKDVPFNEQAEQQNSGLSDVSETSLDLAKRETLWNSIRSAYAAGRSRLEKFSTSSGVRRRKQARALSEEEQEIAEFEPSVEEFELLDNELDDDKSKR
ncbi:hypothetical protein M513_00625 [Trichuris suis]|uniref:Uncharacterized protein n=1 Tax=Trichuris suis TaxID=68888 RepID=A0A085MMF3_9BILA|nr:hypothetical protein M513_00625 [Trichuris suis]